MRWWHRWRLFAVDLADTDSPGLAATFNEDPEGFVFRWSAVRTALFYEFELGAPVRFYVLPVARRPRVLDD